MNETNKMSGLRFGIPRNAYEKAEEAASLQSIYDFDENRSEAAFFMAEHFNISLEKAFELVWRCLKEEEET